MGVVMASNVQRIGQPSSPRLMPSPSMNKDFQVRSTVILLALLTTAAIIYAGYNFQAERSFQLPTDGVWWVEQGGSLVAARVDAGGPGTRAGIKVADQLTEGGAREAMTPHLRPDEIVPSLNREQVMAAAPDTDGAFFRVPKVIER